MTKRYPAPLAGPALPASKVAEQLRAHARLCRQVANASENETIAAELMQLADQCIKAAENIEPEPRPRLH
jgi:hypothetical protein